MKIKSKKAKSTIGCCTACPRKNGPPKYNSVVLETLGKYH